MDLFAYAQINDLQDLEKVDDYCDQTYCDIYIYAKITNPMEANNESTN